MKDDLRQADLSHLTLKQMSADQRAEMRRRFEAFVKAFMKSPAKAKADVSRKVVKWVPGMKRGGSL